ncbi:MAG: hypothetical protein LBT03_00530, partial [Holosporales bacterium]|nr:hypothetical protein [Holosporales bacterium]
MKTNINELLKPQYTYTSGKWYKKGSKEILLSTSDLFDLLRSECDKPEINEIVSSMFKHITNHGLYPIVEYPIVGGNRNQMAHITNARREPI